MPTLRELTSFASVPTDISQRPQFVSRYNHNFIECTWEPHSAYSVFSQYDGPSYYLPRKNLFLRKYRCLFALAKTISPSKIIELGTGAGSSADAYLCGFREAGNLSDMEYIGYDFFNKNYSQLDNSEWNPYEVARKLFSSRNFCRYKLTKIDIRLLKQLEKACMVAIDSASDFFGAFDDMKLALTANPEWILIDDIEGHGVQKAWAKIYQT